jgi:glycosyltransferase involved in cell wall biosynthesis
MIMINRNFRCKESLIKSKKRIGLVFNHSFFLGGGEISFYELIRCLDKKEYEPIVFIPANGEIENKLRLQKYSAYVCPLPPLKKIVSGLPIFSLFKMVKLFKDNKIQIIHVNGSRACFYSGLAGRILGIPVIWHVRETIQDYLLYEYFLILLSKVIICVSKSVEKKRFGRFNKWVKNKIKIVYNGVDTTKFSCQKGARQQVRKHLGVDSQLLFGIIGNIIPLKGQDFFLKGIARAKEYKSDLYVKVLIIGRSMDSEYANEIRKLVTDLKLNNDVIFMNYSAKIVEIFSALDIFVLPSRREGFSRSLLEAMSIGLPIIATKISAIEEALVDNKNGILVDFMNTKKMAFAILALCKNAALRKEMGLRNRLLADKRFSLASHTKRIESLYFGVI